MVSNSGQTKKVDQEIIAAVAGPSPVVPIPQQNFVSTGRYRDDGWVENKLYYLEMNENYQPWFLG